METKGEKFKSAKAMFHFTFIVQVAVQSLFNNHQCSCHFFSFLFVALICNLTGAVSPHVVISEPCCLLEFTPIGPPYCG